MSIPVHDSVARVTLESLPAFARLYSAVCRIPVVRKVRLSSGDGAYDLWVLLGDESPADEEQIYLLERDYRRTAGVFPLEVHVVALSRVDERNLPDADLLFER